MASSSYPGWTPRSERRESYLAPDPARALAALLDQAPDDIGDGSALPPLWHWVYFTPLVRQSELGPDGHPSRGGFLPPVDLPRRMFAGAKLTFHQPLRLGSTATRDGEVLDVSDKTGKSGRLVFVKVRYRFMQEGALAIEEVQDIVYREAGGPVPRTASKPLSEPPAGAWVQTISPDPVMLFRFSALTFNAHRIHYDRPYATEVEHYPGLVVHGPLSAMLLAELVRARAPRPIHRFQFRGIAPLFDLDPFRLIGLEDGNRVTLTAERPDGAPGVEAVAELTDVKAHA